MLRNKAVEDESLAADVGMYYGTVRMGDALTGWLKVFAGCLSRNHIQCQYIGPWYVYWLMQFSGDCETWRQIAVWVVDRPVGRI